jgi:bile acid:Na+ symporter, BASS family
MKPTENRTAIILRFIHRHFIWMIISSYIVAAMTPGFGLWIRNVSFGGAGILQNNLVLSLPLLMLAALLFNAGLGVKTEELTRLLQKPFLLLGGVSGNLMIPVAFIVAVSFLMHIWHKKYSRYWSVLLWSPRCGASTAWSQNANGSLALSLGLVLEHHRTQPFIDAVRSSYGRFRDHWRLFGGFARTRIRRGFCYFAGVAYALPEKFSSRE